MEFMRVVRKEEFFPCAFFIDGKRVSYERYAYEEAQVSYYGTFDCLHTTSTKNTYQHRKHGRKSH